MEPNEFLSPNLLFDQLISSLSTNLLRSLVLPILKYRERIIQILFQILFSPCFYNETEICSPLGKKLSNTEDAKRMFGDARIVGSKLVSKLSVWARLTKWMPRGLGIEVYK